MRTVPVRSTGVNMEKGIRMRIRNTAILMGIMILAVLAGCGESQDSPAPAERAETPESPADVQLSITNELGGWDIIEVLVDPSDSPWGENRLGMDILEPGESIAIDIAPGTWDIMLTDEDLDTYTLWTVEIGAGGYDWIVTLDDMDEVWEGEFTGDPVSLSSGEGDAYVEIVNDLGAWSIMYVWVDPTDSDWGEDRLGADILTPGSDLTVWVDPGMYDIRVEDEDGDTYTLWDIEVGPEGYIWAVTLEDWDI